ncbi:hypothetical protein F4806DRAFT_485188 [Annulohypoxylon nitens]|nr:hypothetical protein F4806DRAFT_485188 [Annulohypoxylon nitens]
MGYKLTIYGVLMATFAFSTTAQSFDPYSYAPNDLLTVDVAIIGGGATGSYAAVTLLDMNHSVVVVEQSAILGGASRTYIDPITGSPIDFGVQVYQNTDIALDFFNRLNVTTTSNIPASYNTTVYAHFPSANILNWAPSSDFTAYIEQLDKYPWMTYTSNVADPVPEDLTIPMSSFVDKYELSDVAYSIFAVYGASLTDSPSFGVLVDAGLAEFTEANNVSSVVGGNGQLYREASKVLGSRVVPNSTVTEARRSQNQTDITSLVINGANGQKLIQAKRLLITIPTSQSNMDAFNPDDKEMEIFRDFYSAGYYVGVARLAQGVLPPKTRFQNADPNAAYHIVPPPALIYIQPSSVENLYRFQFYTADVLSEDVAKSDSQAALEEFVNAFANTSSTEIEIVAFRSTSPWRSRLRGKAIEAGSWRKMYDLQGYRNTWYTGVQFLPGSSQLWNYTASLIPDIVSGL